MTLKEKIEFIDDFLARCEDWMHGDDGIDVTEARKHLIDIEKHLEPSPSTECAMHDVVGQSEQLPNVQCTVCGRTQEQMLKYKCSNSTCPH